MSAAKATDTKAASTDLYRRQGMGQRIGFGERPAVLVIDMQHDFCDPPTTLWPSIAGTYEPIRQLCASARARRLPVFCTQGLVAADGSSAGLWRHKQRYHAEGRVQIDGSKGAAIVPEVAPEPGDRVIRK
jgi:maleamate amidohydrolase